MVTASPDAIDVIVKDADAVMVVDGRADGPALKRVLIKYFGRLYDEDPILIMCGDSNFTPFRGAPVSSAICATMKAAVEHVFEKRVLLEVQSVTSHGQYLSIFFHF